MIPSRVRVTYGRLAFAVIERNRDCAADSRGSQETVFASWGGRTGLRSYSDPPPRQPLDFIRLQPCNTTLAGTETAGVRRPRGSGSPGSGLCSLGWVDRFPYVECSVLPE